LLLVLLGALAVYRPSYSAITLQLPALTTPGHIGWRERQFAGQTEYRAVKEGTRTLLLASSRGTASGLYYERRIDLRRTPVLNWSWKVKTVLQGVDERKKSGDDFPARVYVVVRGGLAFWRTKALSYVWANTHQAGAFWPSPFTANVVLIAAESGEQRLDSLIDEKHNIREDWQRAFHEDISAIDAVAIMTDADNSGQSAMALYSTPWFSEN
jgi:hypothetical protein